MRIGNNHIAIKFLTISLVVLAFGLTKAGAQINNAERFEIDAKRMGLNPTDKDALPRSREFIRLDSSYYVGYMYEGMYKADRSADYFGYANAIPPLRKAFLLLEKDYGSALKTLFSSIGNYIQYVNKYGDYLQIANTLRECYDNIDRPDSVMWLLDRVEANNFPKEHFPVNNIRAWTYHRNRFFTSKKFDFLKNSVEENEKMAFGYCYNALAKIEKHKQRNDGWFGPAQAFNDRLAVYHYLALLHTYNKNYDSTEYYYQQQMAGGTISWNNYGLFQYELGNFAGAYEDFNKDRFKYENKNLKEPYYYMPMLNVFAGRPKDALALCKEAIQFSGSTPGFGWYTIAQARSFMYDGQLDSAEINLQKAADFKEIHIGTTLTQTQYEFTINLLKLQLADRKIALIKFLQKSWWYSPKALYKITSLKVEKLMLQYVLINQLANNPERNRIVYDLFSSESTITFDETWFLINDFTPSFFLEKYKTFRLTDQRSKIIPYFTLFYNKLLWVNGDKKEAFDGLNQMVTSLQADPETEKLFLARLAEGLALAHKWKGNDKETSTYTNALLENYAQLIPFSEVKTSMSLQVTGTDDETTATIVKEIRQCNINWKDTPAPGLANAKINFIQKGNNYEAAIVLQSAEGKIISNTKMVFKASEGAGKEIALRLFNKGGGMVYEQTEQ